MVNEIDHWLKETKNNKYIKKIKKTNHTLVMVFNRYKHSPMNYIWISFN